MPDVPTLTAADHEALRTLPKPFFCPDPARIKKDDRFQIWTKVGGEQQLVSVTVSRPPYIKGKTAQYVDVYGYGIRKSVNVKKLLQPNPNAHFGD